MIHLDIIVKYILSISETQASALLVSFIGTLFMLTHATVFLMQMQSKH